MTSMNEPPQSIGNVEDIKTRESVSQHVEVRSDVESMIAIIYEVGVRLDVSSLSVDQVNQSLSVLRDVGVVVHVVGHDNSRVGGQGYVHALIPMDVAKVSVHIHQIVLTQRSMHQLCIPKTTLPRLFAKG